MGKATGKDRNAGKATLVDFLGIDGARARLAALTGEACAAVAPFGKGAETLTAAARFVMTRRR